jgi:hypothetical protein
MIIRSVVGTLRCDLTPDAGAMEIAVPSRMS